MKGKTDRKQKENKKKKHRKADSESVVITIEGFCCCRCYGTLSSKIALGQRDTLLLFEIFDVEFKLSLCSNTAFWQTMKIIGFDKGQEFRELTSIGIPKCVTSKVKKGDQQDGSDTPRRSIENGCKPLPSEQNPMRMMWMRRLNEGGIEREYTSHAFMIVFLGFERAIGFLKISHV
jgi:hypothetical protein